MKKVSLILFILLGLLGYSYGQSASKATPETRAQKELDRLKTQLNQEEEVKLTDAQEKELYAAYLKKYNCMSSAKTIEDRETVKGALKACHQTARKATEIILSPAQVAFKREKQKEKMLAARQKRANKGEAEISKMKTVLEGELSLTELQEKNLRKIYDQEKVAMKEATKYMNNKETFKQKRREITMETNKMVKSVLSKAQWKAYLAQR